MTAEGDGHGVDAVNRECWQRRLTRTRPTSSPGVGSARPLKVTYAAGRVTVPPPAQEAAGAVRMPSRALGLVWVEAGQKRESVTSAVQVAR